MIVPIATAQLLAGSFRATVAVGTLIGVAVSIAGVTTSYYQNTPSGGTIVLFAIGLFVLVAAVTGLRDRRRERPANPS
jgi:zinc transport system permease protein